MVSGRQPKVRGLSLNKLTSSLEHLYGGVPRYPSKTTTRMAFPVTGRIEVVWLLILQTTYAYYLLLRLPKGLPRLIGLLPLLPPSLLVPWRAPTPVERLVLSFLFLWMIGTKLLLLAGDLGPAADRYSLSTFPRFFFSVTSSVHLKRNESVPNPNNHGVAKHGGHGEGENEGNGHSHSGSEGSLVGEDGSNGTSNSSPGSEGVSIGPVRRKLSGTVPDRNGKLHVQADEVKVGAAGQGVAKGGGISGWGQTMGTSQAWQVVLLRSVFYFMVEVALLRMLLGWRHVMSEYAIVLVLGFFLYFGLLFLFEGAGAMASCLLGVELQPQFNMPFLADSLADFWGRRWNLLVNNLLRVSVYETMLKLLSEKRKPTSWERAVSTAATFLVSGLMHEIFCIYASRLWPSWEVTAFFMVNGLGTIVEGFVFRPRGPCQLPRVLGWAYTMTFVYLTACWLFFAPLFRTGMVDQALEDVPRFVNWLLRTVVL